MSPFRHQRALGDVALPRLSDFVTGAYNDCSRLCDMKLHRNAAQTGLRTNSLKTSITRVIEAACSHGHAAATLFGFCHEKMRAHEGECKVAKEPAKNAPTPALTQQLLLLIDTTVGTTGQPGDVVHTKTSANFMQRDLDERWARRAQIEGWCSRLQQ